MKKLILSILSIFLISNANALGKLNATFELSHNGQFLEFKGKYLNSGLKIKPNKNQFTRPMTHPVEAFRNMYTAYRHSDYKWLRDNSSGDLRHVRSLIEKSHVIYHKNAFYLLGYALYKDYAIVLLENEKNHSREFFVLQLGKDGKYKQSTDFHIIYPFINKLFINSFKKHNNMKVITS